MGTLRFADLQTRPTELLDLASLTRKEFQSLVPPVEAAGQAHADRLLFIWVDLTTSALQVVLGRLFGMGQSQAHQWMHLLLGRVTR